MSGPFKRSKKTAWVPKRSDFRGSSGPPRSNVVPVNASVSPVGPLGERSLVFPVSPAWLGQATKKRGSGRPEASEG